MILLHLLLHLLVEPYVFVAVTKIFIISLLSVIITLLSSFHPIFPPLFPSSCLSILKQTRTTLAKLLRANGKMPYPVKDMDAVQAAADSIGERHDSLCRQR